MMQGIKPTATLFEEDVDENGDLLPPRLDTININLLGCMYTVKLGIYYLKQNPNGGSIVMTGSASSMYYASLHITSCSSAFLLIVPTDLPRLLPFLPNRLHNLQTRRTGPPPLIIHDAAPALSHPHKRHSTLLDRHWNCPGSLDRRVGRRCRAKP